MFDRSKLESLRDVSVTRIGDTLSYGFPQTECALCHSEILHITLAMLLTIRKPLNFSDKSDLRQWKISLAKTDHESDFHYSIGFPLNSL